MKACRGRPKTPQIASALKRIRDGKHPHYRATTKHLLLSGSRGLSETERDLMSMRVRPPAAQPPAQVGKAPPGYASKEQVLEAFGLLEGDLAQVQALGEAARRPPEEGEDEGSSDPDGELS